MPDSPEQSSKDPKDQKDFQDNSGNNLANYEFKTGANWTQENVQTLMQWVHISAIYLEIMSEATQHYKTLLRRHSVLNLILSTLAGTASLSQFSINEQNNPTLTLLLKGFFTFMSFVISISVGYLKIYQIQEKMETTIRLQQEWTVFGSKITSEMQLPENLRKDALFLIIKMKETYFELIKSQVEISKKITRRVAWRNGLNIGDLSLSEIFERVIKGEAMRLSSIAREIEDRDENDTKINIYDGDTVYGDGSDSETETKPKSKNRSYEDDTPEDDTSFKRLHKIGSMLRPKYNPDKLVAIKAKLRKVETKERRATLTNRERLTSYLMKPVAPTLGNSRSSSYAPDISGTGITSPNRRSSVTSRRSSEVSSTKSPKNKDTQMVLSVHNIPAIPAVPVIPVETNDTHEHNDDEELDDHLSAISE